MSFWLESHPEHDRTSCSDSEPLNADPTGSTGCARCTAIKLAQGEAAKAQLKEALAYLEFFLGHYGTKMESLNRSLNRDEAYKNALAKLAEFKTRGENNGC